MQCHMHAESTCIQSLNMVGSTYLDSTEPERCALSGTTDLSLACVVVVGPTNNLVVRAGRNTTIDNRARSGDRSKAFSFILPPLKEGKHLKSVAWWSAKNRLLPLLIAYDTVVVFKLTRKPLGGHTHVISNLLIPNLLPPCILYRRRSELGYLDVSAVGHPHGTPPRPTALASPVARAVAKDRVHAAQSNHRFVGRRRMERHGSETRPSLGSRHPHCRTRAGCAMLREHATARCPKRAAGDRVEAGWGWSWALDGVAPMRSRAEQTLSRWGHSGQRARSTRATNGDLLELLFQYCCKIQLYCWICLLIIIFKTQVICLLL
jgi:hypothetical protein